MKEKIQSLLGGFFTSIKNAKLRFKNLWKSQENAYLFRGLLLFSFVSFFVLCGSSFLLWSHWSKKIEAQHRALASLNEEEEIEEKSNEHEAEESSAEKKTEDSPATDSLSVGVRSIPKSISKRQDGVPEPDKDLVMPEYKEKGILAKVQTPAVAPAPYNPFFNYPDIVGSTSNSTSMVAKVAIDLSLEVDSFAVMKELEEREHEIKFMISSLVAENTYEDYRTDKGTNQLKKRIFKEVNYILKSGQIKDVLYNNFVMK